MAQRGGQDGVGRGDLGRSAGRGLGVVVVGGRQEDGGSWGWLCAILILLLVVVLALLRVRRAVDGEKSSSSPCAGAAVETAMASREQWSKAHRCSSSARRPFESTTRFSVCSYAFSSQLRQHLISSRLISSHLISSQQQASHLEGCSLLLTLHLLANPSYVPNRCCHGIFLLLPAFSLALSSPRPHRSPTLQALHPLCQPRSGSRRRSCRSRLSPSRPSLPLNWPPLLLFLTPPSSHLSVLCTDRCSTPPNSHCASLASPSARLRPAPASHLSPPRLHCSPPGLARHTLSVAMPASNRVNTTKLQESAVSLLPPIAPSLFSFRRGRPPLPPFP